MSSVHAFFAEIQLFEGTEKPYFPEKLFEVFRLKKIEKRTKIEDREGEAGKIFLNMTSANLLCTSSTLGPHGKPGINYQQCGPFFSIDVYHLSTVISTSSHRRENAL